MNTRVNDKLTAGLRMTRQRELILAQCVPGQHVTADEVYLRVRRELPRISLATVYRNLEILSRAGLIRTLHLGAGQRLYDGGLHDHYHVRCLRCGKVCDVPAEEFGDLDVTARKVSNYEILDHELGFEGVCATCRATAPKTGGDSCNQ